MGSYCGVVLIANSGGASAAPAGRICRRSSYSISIAIGPEHLTLSLVESGSAAEVGDPRRGHFTGCRNQHSSPLREPGLRPPRPGFSYNDRVTNGDPSNGDHAHYSLRAGSHDSAFYFSRRLSCSDNLVGLDDFITSNHRGCMEVGWERQSPLAMPLPPRQASREEPGPAPARSGFLLR